MPKLLDLQRETINGFAGQLLDAAYSLLALPSLSRMDRFMIVYDLSFFCHFERGKTITEPEFIEFTRTLLQPFIVDEWVKSFEFYDEARVAEAKTIGEHTLPKLPKFDAFVAQFAHNWYRVFKGLESVIEEYRPMQTVAGLVRPRDTEIPNDAIDILARSMNTPVMQTLMSTALPPEWLMQTHFMPGDSPKFMYYRREFTPYGNDEPTYAYILVYLPTRFLMGLPELRQTFA